MSGRPSRETVMQALYEALVASVVTNFAADTQVDSPVLLNPSTTEGLFVGLPVFGLGVPRGAVISSLSPLTLNQPVAGNASQAAFTTGFLTTSRRFQYWNQCEAQPALFLRGKNEDLDYPQGNIQQLQVIRAEVWVYTRAGDDATAVPEIALNNLLDAVQSVFQADSPMGVFTLGGLVSWCRMSGKVDKQPGDPSGQAMAAADIEIFVP